MSASSLHSQVSSDAPFSGVGSWLDIFARRGWAHPDAVIASLRQHDISTLYLETSNYSQSAGVIRPTTVSRLIDDAHAAGLKVVAWYLPSFARPQVDLARALSAVRFRSATGQAFDGFALDIEASLVRDVVLRNDRLLALTRSLRIAAPPGYQLSAIVPSPVGMRRHPKYWPQFPFAQLAANFDAFLPMAYFTYYANTPRAAYDYAHDVVTSIRLQSGRPDIPIHIIGGLANNAALPAITSFLQASADCNVTGVSLYAYFETNAAEWSALRTTRLPNDGSTHCTP